MKVESCEDCGCKYHEGTEDYHSIYWTGYCGDCIVEHVAKWRGVVEDDTKI
ncbi:hypothetical protein [Streptococcus marmotae]|uniref:hypothetical protein n=1 Tax=Streptococcus marmotae TaxID=1825069 RepID=UPI000A8CC108|nr:hypothetical protein [Streptococcus marmotae]